MIESRSVVVRVRGAWEEVKNWLQWHEGTIFWDDGNIFQYHDHVAGVQLCLFIKTPQTLQLELVILWQVNYNSKKLMKEGEEKKRGEGKKKRRKEVEKRGGRKRRGGRREWCGFHKDEACLSIQWILILSLGVNQGLGSKGETSLILNNLLCREWKRYVNES